MPWVRDRHGRFSDKQHRRMAGLHARGMSLIKIGKLVDCSPQAVGHSVRKILAEEQGRGEKAVRTAEAINEAPVEVQVHDIEKVIATLVADAPGTNEPEGKLAAEVDYLRWCLRGAMRRVDGQSFVDRLLADAARGDVF